MEIYLKYDPLGNRVWKQSFDGSNTAASRYIVDIVGDLPVILCVLDDNDDLAASFFYALDQILCQYQHGPYAYDRYFYVHDRLGSIRQVIDQNGAIRNRYTYEPFGQAFPTQCDEQVANPFRFTGQWYDAEIAQPGSLGNLWPTPRSGPSALSRAAGAGACRPCSAPAGAPTTKPPAAGLP